MKAFGEILPDQPHVASYFNIALEPSGGFPSSKHPNVIGR